MLPWRFRVSAVNSMITGTKLAASPALPITRSKSSAVNSSALMPVIVALSTAESTFRSPSVTFTGSLMSLLTTSSLVNITTRITLP